jgi:N-acetylglucosaminyldiphosphoundecaprenol N-acetyl-beta-D-mannosaminyltransferase
MRRLTDGWRGPRRGTLELGGVPVDRVDFGETLEAIQALVESGLGGRVFTPNVDHVMLCQEHPGFLAAYREASLRLADGVPVVWAARALGRPVPEKISGSDLVWPLMERAAQRGWRVFLLGAGPGVAEAAAKRFGDELGVTIAGVDGSFVKDPLDPLERGPILERIKRSRAELVLIAFGAPKQELFAHAARHETGAVFVGVGASLDFVAGTARRAPKWMSRFGLEWLYRLVQEPRRLWRRYLVRDPKFFALVARQWWASRRVSARSPQVQLPEVTSSRALSTGSASSPHRQSAEPPAPM